MAHISDFPVLPVNAGSSLITTLGNWLAAKFQVKAGAKDAGAESHWDPETELMTPAQPTVFARLADQHPVTFLFKR